MNKKIKLIQTRDSLLDLKRILSENDSPNFEGLYNLSLIFLFTSIILLIINNYLEKGILVDLKLINCLIRGQHIKLGGILFFVKP
jgi:hypothetical protein